MLVYSSGSPVKLAFKAPHIRDPSTEAYIVATQVGRNRGNGPLLASLTSEIYLDWLIRHGVPISVGDIAEAKY
jgi:hypothetical protein